MLSLYPGPRTKIRHQGNSLFPLLDSLYNHLLDCTSLKNLKEKTLITIVCSSTIPKLELSKVVESLAGDDWNPL